jgi:cytochrome c551/c552
VLKHIETLPGNQGALLRDKGCVHCHDPHQADRKYLLREKS